MEVQLEVLSSDDRRQALRLTAESAAHAIRQATERGLRVISVIEDREERPARVSARFDAVLFSQELIALLEAGLNVSTAIAALRRKAVRPGERRVLQALLLDVEQGKPLSEAMTRFPQHFPPVYIATVRANEMSGSIASALERYVSYQGIVDALKRRVVTASIYPLVLLTVGAAVSLFLIGYVVPKFSAVYDSAGRDLPLLSEVLIAVGSWINRHSVLFIALALSLLGTTIYAITNPAIRARAIQFAVALPWIRPRAREFRFARLYRTIGLLVSSGVPLPKAIEMTQSLMVGAERVALQNVKRALEEGKPLSTALRTHELSTPIADSLLAVGEQGGRLGEMLERTARFHDEDFARRIDMSSRLIEPALMIFIGLVIGGIVVLMYMPIFELAGSLG